MKICERCGISEQEVRLFDAIYDGGMQNLCERCSIIENVPIIKKPNSSQLKESEKCPGVYDRMKRLSGIREEKKEETFFVEDKLDDLDNNPELELPEKSKLNLIDYFHWEIMKHRRRKGLSPQQLAENIGESSIAVVMIEKGRLPENAEIIIRKLEQFFQIKLRQISERDRMRQAEKRGPVLLDSKGKEIEIIPEEEINILGKKELEEKVGIFEEDTVKDIQDRECQVSEQELISKSREDVKDLDINSKEKNEETPKSPLECVDELDLDKIDKSAVTIADLKEMHRKKIEVTKQEQIEEQKKIEERRRILEALRERDRLKQEEKIKQEQLEQQKIEEEKKRLIEQRKEELRRRHEEELGDVDKYLGGSELLGKDKKEFDSNSVEEFDKELI